MNSKTISLIGIGMMTPLGDNAKMTAAAVRAGISAFSVSSIYNKYFMPMTLALIPEEAIPSFSTEINCSPNFTESNMRMLQLSQKPLAEALSNLPIEIKVPLFLALPEEISGFPPRIYEGILNDLYIQCNRMFDVKRSRYFNNGRASGIEALVEAFDVLMKNEVEFVLVGGCDSYMDIPILESLDKDDRVLAEGIMCGFAPAEGAAFLLLASEQTAKKHSIRSIAQIYLPIVTDEPGHRYSKQPYKGDGLSNAIAGAIEPLENEKVQTVFAGFNGENFFAKEWGVAYLRNYDNFTDKLRVEHPADCFGDTGTAVAPLLIGLAAIGMQKQYIKGPCLIFCSSEKEKRGAVCVKSCSKGT